MSDRIFLRMMFLFALILVLCAGVWNAFFFEGLIGVSGVIGAALSGILIVCLTYEVGQKPLQKIEELEQQRFEEGIQDYCEGSARTAEEYKAKITAFCQGAAWWEWHKEEGRNPTSLLTLAEEEATKRARDGTLGKLKFEENERS